MRVAGIIPARLAATRLPDKPLLDLGGKPMIQRVYERALRAKRLEAILVATPDERIFECVRAFGGQAVMTSDRHRSGTDRVAEANEILGAEIVVNIQGDEPLLDTASIDASVEPLLAEPDLEMASLMCPCPEEERDNPATVKVVAALNGDALYFSRARIPFERNPIAGVQVMQHIGLYAYRREFLRSFPTLPASPLELFEGLEQLRALENGHRIRMVRVEQAPLSVDTPDDLERVRRLIRND